MKIDIPQALDGFVFGQFGEHFARPRGRGAADDAPDAASEIERVVELLACLVACLGAGDELRVSMPDMASGSSESMVSTAAPLRAMLLFSSASQDGTFSKTSIAQWS